MQLLPTCLIQVPIVADNKYILCEQLMSLFTAVYGGDVDLVGYTLEFIQLTACFEFSAHEGCANYQIR